MSKKVENQDHIVPVTLDFAGSANPYDVIPYVGRSYGVVHPENLYCLARLRGIEAVPMEKMRVLEIGCATGGNLLPIGCRNPNSECVGIDPSRGEIDVANERAEKSGISNCKFYPIGAEDLDKSYGKFDYIICHGVFSWIPDFARDAVLGIAQKHLSPNGLAVISYNCKPGWNFLASIRDAAVFHSRNIRDPYMKVQQSRKFIELIGTSRASQLYNDYFTQYNKKIASYEDAYILHEHLSEVNHAFYFGEFMAEAEKHGLSYLCETGDNYADDLSVFTPEIRGLLQSIEDPLIREQYIDYMVNRQFRSTIVRLADCESDEKVKESSRRDIYYRARYASELTQQDGVDVLKVRVNNSEINIKDQTVIKVLQSLKESSESALNISEWSDEIKVKYPTLSISKEEIEQNLGSAIVTLNSKGFFKNWPSKPPLAREIEAKPKVFSYLRFMSDYAPDERSSNYFGESLAPLSKQLRIMVSLMDGSHSHDDLAAATKEAFQNGDLLLPDKMVAQILNQTYDDDNSPRYSRFERVTALNALSAEALDSLVSQALQAGLNELQARKVLLD